MPGMSKRSGTGPNISICWIMESQDVRLANHHQFCWGTATPTKLNTAWHSSRVDFLPVENAREFGLNMPEKVHPPALTQQCYKLNTCSYTAPVHDAIYLTLTCQVLSMVRWFAEFNGDDFIPKKKRHLSSLAFPKGHVNLPTAGF